MHARTLGQGLQVSAIGLGAMGMSQSYGPNPGDRQAVITVVGGLTHAAGSYTTPAGHASVSWTVNPDGRVALTAAIPASTTAEIWVPTSGQPVTAPPAAESWLRLGPGLVAGRMRSRLPCSAPFTCSGSRKRLSSGFPPKT